MRPSAKRRGDEELSVATATRRSSIIRRIQPKPDSGQKQDSESELPWRLVQLQSLIKLFPNLIIAVDVTDVAMMMRISESTVWAMCDETNRAFDSNFPKPKKHRVLRRTVWRLDAVQTYMRDWFDGGNS